MPGHCAVWTVPNRTRANDGWDQQCGTFWSQKKRTEFSLGLYFTSTTCRATESPCALPEECNTLTVGFTETSAPVRGDRRVVLMFANIWKLQCVLKPLYSGRSMQKLAYIMFVTAISVTKTGPRFSPSITTCKSTYGKAVRIKGSLQKQLRALQPFWITELNC